MTLAVRAVFWVIAYLGAVLQYFICGSEPMMDAVESALIGLQVPPERVHTERFGMV